VALVLAVAVTVVGLVLSFTVVPRDVRTLAVGIPLLAGALLYRHLSGWSDRDPDRPSLEPPTSWLYDTTYRFRHPWRMSGILGIGTAVFFGGLTALDGSVSKALTVAASILVVVPLFVRFGLLFERPPSD
jgi:hypothetical protein